jgi:hypothetical protein
VPGCRIVSRGTNHAALWAATFIPNYQSGPASREAVSSRGRGLYHLPSSSTGFELSTKNLLAKKELQSARSLGDRLF